MPTKNLGIDRLELDLANPRISKATDQREAMQRIIDDQDVKLANLAESIVDEGLNPMDRLLVIKSENNRGRYAVLEGNRRVAALKVLKNPSVLGGLDVRPSLRARFESLAARFDPADVEPVACFEVSERAEGTSWIEQRHTGENEGKGIVNWSGVASSRFRGRDPALQALDFVLQHANLTDEQKGQIEEQFPISTLDRLLSTPGVRSKIGFEVRDGRLLTALPPDQAIKPLKRIVLDLAEKKINVTKLKLKNQQIDYVSQLGAADTPDLSRMTSSLTPVEDIAEQDFPSPLPSPAKKPRIPKSVDRRTLVPRSSSLKVGNPNYIFPTTTSSGSVWLH